MSINKYQTEEASAAPAPANAKGRLVDHCKRFWWVHLLVLIILTAILVPILLLVAVPKIAQAKLDAAQLELVSLTVENTFDDRATISISSIIRTDGSVHAIIDGFQGTMRLENRPPFINIAFPATTADAYQEVNITQETIFTDRAEWTEFNKVLMTQDTFRVTVEGNTNVHVRGISRAYPVTFSKTVDVQGMRQFNGTRVEESRILTTKKRAESHNFVGTVIIPNYSLVTAHVGNVSFFNYLDGKDVGTVWIDNMVLRPGNNTFPMRAKVDQITILGAVMKRPACETGLLPFQLAGKDVVNDSGRIGWLAEALGSFNQTLNIDIGGTIKKSLSVTIACR